MIEKYITPFFVVTFILGLSVFSLGAAYIAEIFFALEPCILCLYQRIPFALAIIAAGGVLLVDKISGYHRRTKIFTITAGLLGLLYFCNGLIAAYHTGVEQKWWASALEGCKINFGTADQAQDLLQKIMTAPNVPCDEIPWQDPILGLSMANYNALLGFGVALLCTACVIISLRTKR